MSCLQRNVSPAPILFLHANVYPAGVYRAFLQGIAAVHPVTAIDTIGVDPAYRPGRGWRGALVSVTHATGLSRCIGLAPIADRRRRHWPSREEARRHLGAKPFVQRWAPGVLDDFNAAGLRDDPAGGVMLTFPRETECDIYATLAHREAASALRRLRKRGVPVGFVAGSESEEVRLAGLEQNRRFWGPDWVEVPGGQLISMEAPQACADAVAGCIA